MRTMPGPNVLAKQMCENTKGRDPDAPECSGQTLMEQASQLLRWVEEVNGHAVRLRNNLFGPQEASDGPCENKSVWGLRQLLDHSLKGMECLRHRRIELCDRVADDRPGPNEGMAEGPRGR